MRTKSVKQEDRINVNILRNAQYFLCEIYYHFSIKRNILMLTEGLCRPVNLS